MSREFSVLIAWVVLLAVLALVAPAFFAFANLRDLMLANAPSLLLAAGMTLVIIAGQIDISVGSQFAVLSVAAGLLARSGMPLTIVVLAVATVGAALGAINGVLIARLQIPSIVVTLAAMIVLRDLLRWTTGGAWVENLPEHFQWFGFTQQVGEAFIVIASAILYAGLAWLLRNLAGARAIYAVGSDAESARLAGISVQRTLFAVFAAMGVFAALAAMLNVIRFREIQSNTGLGLELKAIAAVVVGGASITGGRGSFTGTLLGVGLLATIGPALTFLGVNPYWEKAIQGAIILTAVSLNITSVKSRRARQGSFPGTFQNLFRIAFSPFRKKDA